MKQLKNLMAASEKIETTNQQSFLKNIYIEQRNSRCLEGCYEVCTEEDGKELFHDTGFFQTQKTRNGNEYSLIIDTRNSRFSKNLKSNISAPIDQIFPMSNEKKFQTFHFVEDFLLVENRFVIHFSDDIDIVEIYELDSDLSFLKTEPGEIVKMPDTPMIRFLKGIKEKPSKIIPRSPDISLNQQIYEIAAMLKEAKLEKKKD